MKKILIPLLLLGPCLQAQTFENNVFETYDLLDEPVRIYYEDRYDRLEKDWDENLTTLATLMLYYDRYEKECYEDSFLYKGFELIPYDDPISINYPQYQYIVEWRYTHPTFVGFVEYLRTMQK